MSNAPKVLVDTASKYASEAIKFDSQGSRGTAIQKYQQAVDTLLRLAKLHPNYALNKIYLKNAKIYQDRITALQNTTSTSNNIIKSNPSNGGQQASIIEPLNASYGDVILQEKPNGMKLLDWTMQKKLYRNLLLFLQLDLNFSL